MHGDVRVLAAAMRRHVGHVPHASSPPSCARRTVDRLRERDAPTARLPTPSGPANSRLCGTRPRATACRSSVDRRRVADDGGERHASCYRDRVAAVAALARPGCHNRVLPVGAVSSVVEHRPYTPAVTGSSPVPPTSLRAQARQVERSKAKLRSLARAVGRTSNVRLRVRVARFRKRGRSSVG